MIETDLMVNLDASAAADDDENHNLKYSKVHGTTYKTSTTVLKNMP